MQRIRMDIAPGVVGREERDSAQFASPRKRFMQREYGESPHHPASPSAKHRRLSTEHRLSTDSLGSTSDRR